MLYGYSSPPESQARAGLFPHKIFVSILINRFWFLNLRSTNVALHYVFRWSVLNHQFIAACCNLFSAHCSLLSFNCSRASYLPKLFTKLKVGHSLLIANFRILFLNYGFFCFIIHLSVFSYAFSIIFIAQNYVE